VLTLALNSFSAQQNPFVEDEWDDDVQEAKSDVDPANAKEVRALYDYEGQEDDEISFKVGECVLLCFATRNVSAVFLSLRRSLHADQGSR
jgi:hypothetical protein